MPPRARQRREPADTSSVTADNLDSGPLTPDDMAWMGNDPTVPVDAIIVDDPQDEETPKSRLKTGYQPPVTDVALSSGPPKLDEWLDFFSRVLIGTATDFAIEMAFRGVDEDLLSDREVATIKLDKEERDRIARPLAEYAFKNKYTRKHGREIIALAGSIDAVLQLGIWYTRITRIAMKYKRMQGGQPQRPSRRERMRNRPQPQPQRHEQKVVIVTPQEVIQDERTGQSQANHNGHSDTWRPDVGGPVVNPGG